MNQSPAAPDSPHIFAIFARYVALAQRHAGWLVGGLALCAVLCLVPVLQLELHTDLAELLPPNHPAVLALRRIAGRQKSATNLVMIVSSPDQQANHRFAEALRPQLERMIPEVFTELQWRPDPEIPDYASHWRWMYTEHKDLLHAEELLDRIIAKRSSPLMVDFEGDPEKELRDLRQRLNQKLPRRSDSPYFENEEHGTHYLGVMMWRRRDGLATRGDHDTLLAVQHVVKALNPAAFSPQMQVEFTGHIAQAIDEQNGIRDDLNKATVLCTTLVLVAIYLYFRRAALLLVIGAPAVLGVLCSLVLAHFTIHYLNINTAFLISIILGNGINSPIVLLARYGEERQHGRDVIGALGIALSATLRGTATATVAASIAYGCLLLTSFRGFNQFGLIGGAGMIFVWVLTFFMVPPLVILGERLWPGRLTPRRNLWRIPFDWLGRMANRHPVVPAAVSVVLLLAAAAPLAKWARDPLEWDFSRLRTDNSNTPSQRLWPRMESLGMGDVGAGYIGNNGVMLVDRPDQADPVADAMRDKDRKKGKLHVMKEVRTIHSVLPKDQDEKLEILKRLRGKIDKHRDIMDAAEWADVEPWRPPEYLRRLTVDDLPRQVREAFTEVDGQRGRLIGIDADHETYYDWNGHDLLRMSDAMQVQALGQTWVAASAATIFAGMLETIIEDGPRVTLAALVLVTLLVLLAFGVRGGIPVLASLGIGIVWLGGVAGVIDLKLNFMNFVALPITLGIGTEYAANIWARLRQDGLDHIQPVIADTGSAVALCSSTTIIGYSSLLLSHNLALRSFGKLADLGEMTCLVAAVIALPAILKYAYLRRRDRELND